MQQKWNYILNIQIAVMNKDWIKPLQKHGVYVQILRLFWDEINVYQHVNTQNISGVSYREYKSDIMFL